MSWRCVTPTAAEAATLGTAGVPVSIVTVPAEVGVKLIDADLNALPADRSSVKRIFSRNRFLTNDGKSYFDQSSQMLVHVTALPNSLIRNDAAESGVGSSGIRTFSASAPSSTSAGPVMVKRFTVSPRFFPDPSTGSTHKITSAFSKLAS